MKAYECDRCETYHQGSPAGVLYDNSDPKHGVRYDLCAECLERALSEIEHDVVHLVVAAEIAEENEG